MKTHVELGTSALAVWLAFGVGSQALASPTTTVSVQAGTSSAGPVTASTPTSLSVTGTGVFVGLATASAIADFGSLGVSESGSSPQGPGLGGSNVGSRAEASFTDYLDIGGANPGSPVSLMFELDAVGACAANSTANCIVQGSLALPGGTGASVESSIILGVPISNVTSGAGTLSWTEGTLLPIAGDFLAMGDAFDNGSYTGDFASTLHFYVWSTTPGVVITSQSGHDYSPPAAPVPEPSTVSLLGSGLVFVVGAGRRLARAGTR